MEAYSEVDRHFVHLMMKKRTVLQARLDNLGDSHRNSVEAAPRREVEHRLEEMEKALTRMDAGRHGICEMAPLRDDTVHRD